MGWQTKINELTITCLAPSLLAVFPEGEDLKVFDAALWPPPSIHRLAFPNQDHCIVYTYLLAELNISNACPTRQTGELGTT